MGSPPTDGRRRSCDPGAGIYYAAPDAKTCLAEVFQTPRRIDRAFQSPWLAVFECARPLLVVDLTGDFATRMGAPMAIHSGGRERARGWARDLYEAFSKHSGNPLCVIHERRRTRICAE